MQAKSEPAQPVAFMPACVADSWRLGCVRDRGAKKGGVSFREGGFIILTAQLGSSVRAPRSTRVPAVAKGAAKRVRAAMEYFILGIFSSLIFLLALRSLVCLYGFYDKSSALQSNTNFNESVGRKVE